MNEVGFVFLYTFSGLHHFLVEIKRTDDPAASAKDQVFHWLLISKNELEIRKLRFKAMRTVDGRHIRDFLEAGLSFNDTEGVLSLHDGSVEALENIPFAILPQEIVLRISDYLRNHAFRATGICPNLIP